VPGHRVETSILFAAHKSQQTVNKGNKPSNKMGINGDRRRIGKSQRK
jgi:hypothetical protein